MVGSLGASSKIFDSGTSTSATFELSHPIFSAKLALRSYYLGPYLALYLTRESIRNRIMATVYLQDFYRQALKLFLLPRKGHFLLFVFFDKKHVS